MQLPMDSYVCKLKKNPDNILIMSYIFSLNSDSRTPLLREK